MPACAECDARHGSFDFRAAHAEAAPDLREMLDSHESLPFRRRGYERDGMLMTVIRKSGFAQQFKSSQQSEAEVLAPVPAEVAHFGSSLDTLFDRPVQNQLVQLLLMPKEERRYTSCVLLHGMGGTGKVGGLGLHDLSSDSRPFAVDGDGGGSGAGAADSEAILLGVLANGRRRCSG